MSSNETPMIQLTIDGKNVSVPKGTTVYNAAKKLGIDIPIFCYIDRMPPFGACRMCLVEVEKMGKLQASCTLEATEGMVVKTQSSHAVDGRQEILELLLINHPLDCPICDRGGECPLQENALTHGPSESRFFEEKRHFKKPLPLGPVLMLDRERCIVCARCTRFGDVIAGDHALEFVDRGYKTEVGTPDSGPAESKYIGNTIAICPVGALTSQVYRFRARPWDNQPTNSTCTLCPVGCSLILDSRDGEIMRTRAQENHDVNDIWLCDKGWFGYEFISSPDRLQTPLIRKNGHLHQATWDEAIALIVQKFTAAMSSRKLAAFGGNPLTIEENYLFQKLFRDVGKTNNIDHRVGMPLLSLDEEGIQPGMESSIGDCENVSFALLLGVDLTEEFPIIWLRLRQAINKGAKVVFIGHYAPEIASLLTETIIHTPGKEVELLKEQIPKFSGNGTIFVGSQYLNSPNRKPILSELLKLKDSTTSLNLLEGRGNSFGARFAGMRPDLGPLNEQIKNPGLNCLQVLEQAAATGWDMLYVAGANPAQKFSAKLWNSAREKLGFLVVQDLFLTETAQQADVVLPTLCFVEKGGTFMNVEGRLQSLLPGKEVPESIYSDGEIFALIAKNLKNPISIESIVLQKLKTSRIPFTRPSSIAANPVQNQNNTSGKLAATFAHALFDHGVRMKHNVHVLELAKEPYVRLNPQDAKTRGIKTGDTVRLNTVKAKAKCDAGVAEGTVVIPLGFEEIPVYELSNTLTNGLLIEVQKAHDS